MAEEQGRRDDPPRRASHLAPFDPEERSAPLPLGLALRPAREADALRVAQLEAAREGWDVAEALRRCRRDLADPDTVLVVAALGDTVVGFGRAGLLTPWASGPSHGMPAGWYLLGLVVADDWRRRGIGHALTRERLRLIAERSGEAFYFTNARNLASRRLHEAFGFVELTRDFSAPRIAFDGGEGMLFRVDLRAHDAADPP